MKKVLAVILGVALAASLIYAFIILAGLFAAPVVMLAWNMSIPYVFGLPHIGYWHAFGLWVLAGFLVKSVQTNNNKEK